MRWHEFLGVLGTFAAVVAVIAFVAADMAYQRDRRPRLVAPPIDGVRSITDYDEGYPYLRAPAAPPWGTLVVTCTAKADRTIDCAPAVYVPPGEPLP